MKSLVSTACLALVASCPTTSFAGSQTPGVVAAPESSSSDFCDRIEKLPVLYKDKSNPYIQEVRLSARMQYQWGGTNGDTTFPGGREWVSEWRTLRLGTDIRFLNRFMFRNTWDLGGLSGRGSYNKSDQSWNKSQTEGQLFEIFLRYTQPEAFALTVGKIEDRMTTEYRTSSAHTRTVERSSFVNQMRADTSWGFQFSNPDKKDKFHWVAGLFASAQDGQYGTSPEWSSGYALFTLSYDVSRVLLEKGRVWLDYTYTNQDMADVASNSSYRGMRAKNFWCLSYEGSQNKSYLLSEIMLGQDLAQKNINGDPAGYALGFTLLPTYDLTPWMQAAFRYQYAQSPGGGLRLDSRYFRTLSPDTQAIDRYNAFYFGLNFFLCPKYPDLAKLMLGAEFLASTSAKPNQDAFNGWIYSIALRTNF